MQMPSATHLRVLVINAAGSCEGDVNMLLLAIKSLDPRAFHIYAAIPPRGAVFEALRDMLNVRLVPVEMGGSETSPGQHRGIAARIAALGGAIPVLTRLVLREKIDVIYAIDRTVAPRLAAAVSRLTGRPFLLSAHYPFYGRDSRWNRMVLRQAALIHVPAKHHTGWIAPYLRDTRRVVLIPNALQVERYDLTIDAGPLRRRLGLDEASGIVVMAGRLSPYKGQDDLITAARHILAVRPDTHFLLAGHDTSEAMHTHGPHATSFRRILEGLIAQYDLEGRVRLLGHYPHHQLPELFALATVTAMPSWAEPFGLVALESMAMAKPVVATRAGGVSEFVHDGVTGLLVPPRAPQALAEALLTLLTNPEYAKEMGNRGREHVEVDHNAQIYAQRVGQALQTAHRGVLVAGT